MKYLAYSMPMVALAFVAGPAGAETDASAAGAPGPAVAASAQTTNQGTDNEFVLNEVVVTATRRSERLMDVPLSITAFSQDELTQMGIVGLEGIARETPGAVLNVASDDNYRLTARGISTNGWGAGLQTTTTIYLDELPISTIGNTITLNPNLYDVRASRIPARSTGHSVWVRLAVGRLAHPDAQPRPRALRCIHSRGHR